MAVQQHADIIAVSYEARALGVKKHMPVSAIRREHPTVRLVHVEVCVGEQRSDFASCLHTAVLIDVQHLSGFCCYLVRVFGGWGERLKLCLCRNKCSGLPLVCEACRNSAVNGAQLGHQPCAPCKYLHNSSLTDRLTLSFDVSHVAHLPPQQTIGLQNDKVSYRSYRAAARAIFTLVRAFCPPEGDLCCLG